MESDSRTLFRRVIAALCTLFSAVLLVVSAVFVILHRQILKAP
jgi:hypothetical protein